MLGPVGLWAVSRAKEPLMASAVQSRQGALAILAEPLRDRNFSQLVRFLFLWSLTSNLAIPFFAVFMLTRLGLSVPAVIGLTVLSQLANVVFLKVWGPLADRVGSKTVLSLSASLFLLVILGWTFTTHPDRYFLTVPLLVILHIFAGIATAGVTLTVRTLALKVAPPAGGSAYVGTAGIAASVGSGIGPILGGLMADYFLTRSLHVDLTWTSTGSLVQLPAITLAGFDFLFAIAFVLGLLSLNLLVALREEGEVSRDVALTELMAGLGPMARAVSSVPGLGILSEVSYGYLRRAPGADVAIGVMAYQLASSTQAAVSSVGRGRTFVRDVHSHVSMSLYRH